VFRFIAAERACHSVKMLCRVLGVSRSNLSRLGCATALAASARRRRLVGAGASCHRERIARRGFDPVRSDRLVFQTAPASPPAVVTSIVRWLGRLTPRASYRTALSRWACTTSGTHSPRMC
jgi:hypothetical protein